MDGSSEFWEEPRWYVGGTVGKVAGEAFAKLISTRPVDDLIEEIHHQDAVVRKAAVIALGQVGGERAVEPLLMAVYDREADSWVNRAAVKALKALGEGDLATEVEGLVAGSFADSRDTTREEAIAALGARVQDGDERVSRVLRHLCARGSPKLRANASRALAEPGDIVDGWTEADEPELTVEAAIAAAMSGDPTGVPTLMQHLGKLDAETGLPVVEARAAEVEPQSDVVGALVNVGPAVIPHLTPELERRLRKVAQSFRSSTDGLGWEDAKKGAGDVAWCLDGVRVMRSVVLRMSDADPSIAATARSALGAALPAWRAVASHPWPGVIGDLTRTKELQKRLLDLIKASEYALRVT